MPESSAPTVLILEHTVKRGQEQKYEEWLGGVMPTVRLTDYQGKHPEFISIAYPKVGDPNPRVRIGVVDVATGQSRMLDLGETGEFLVPRVYWTAAPDPTF